MTFNYITPPENAGQIPFRFLSTIIARRLARTVVTPNQVTIFRALIVTISLFFFARGDSKSLVIGVVLFYVFEVLDHVDGDLARLTNRISPIGPLLEQFVDTWGSRPSNIFGFCIALGMYRQTASIAGFVLFGLTALGRMLWLEYRDIFGWQRKKKGPQMSYKGILGNRSFKSSLRNAFEVLYIWNNAFLLLGAILYPISSEMYYNSLVIGFCIVAILNNLPWIAITIIGFKNAWGTR